MSEQNNLILNTKMLQFWLWISFVVAIKLEGLERWQRELMLELGAKTRCADVSLPRCAWSYTGPGPSANHLLVHMLISFPRGQSFVFWAALEEDVGNFTVAVELSQDVVTAARSVPPSTVLLPKARVPLCVLRASRVNAFVQPKFKSPKS